MENQQEFTEALQPVIALFDSFGIIGKLVQLAIAVLTFVSMWIVYCKAGQGGWKLLIPIYGDYIRFKIAHCAGRFWANLLLPIISTVLIVLGVLQGAGSVTGILESAGAAGPMILIGVILVIITAVIRITVPFKMAAAFHCSGAFGLGLWLLPTVFYAILAFNRSIVYDRKETIYRSL